MIAPYEVHEVFPAGDERNLVAVLHLGGRCGNGQGAQKTCRNECDFAFHSTSS
jgi:hypothetical protein